MNQAPKYKLWDHLCELNKAAKDSAAHAFAQEIISAIFYSNNDLTNHKVPNHLQDATRGLHRVIDFVIGSLPERNIALKRAKVAHRIATIDLPKAVRALIADLEKLGANKEFLARLGELKTELESELSGSRPKNKKGK